MGLSWFPGLTCRVFSLVRGGMVLVQRRCLQAGMSSSLIDGFVFWASCWWVVWWAVLGSLGVYACYPFTDISD